MQAWKLGLGDLSKLTAQAYFLGEVNVCRCHEFQSSSKNKVRLVKFFWSNSNQLLVILIWSSELASFETFLNIFVEKNLIHFFHEVEIFCFQKKLFSRYVGHALYSSAHNYSEVSGIQFVHQAPRPTEKLNMIGYTVKVAWFFPSFFMKVLQREGVIKKDRSSKNNLLNYPFYNFIHFFNGKKLECFKDHNSCFAWYPHGTISLPLCHVPFCAISVNLTMCLILDLIITGTLHLIVRT